MSKVITKMIILVVGLCFINLWLKKVSLQQQGVL